MHTACHAQVYIILIYNTLAAHTRQKKREIRQNYQHGGFFFPRGRVEKPAALAALNRMEKDMVAGDGLSRCAAVRAARGCARIPIGNFVGEGFSYRGTSRANELSFARCRAILLFSNDIVEWFLGINYVS